MAGQLLNVSSVPGRLTAESWRAAVAAAGVRSEVIYSISMAGGRARATQ
jgi:hypothetical protein